MTSYAITRTCQYTETLVVEAESNFDAWEKSQGVEFLRANDDVIVDEKIEAQP